MVPPVHSSARLAGKCAVVTGGNRGIGLAIARALVADGANILITGRDRVALREAKGELAGIAEELRSAPQVFAEQCDVREERSVAGVLAKVKKRWGRLAS